MGVDEISVMDGAKCILQVRGVRPFFSNKYDIEKHPNYKYLSDSNPKFEFNIVKFLRKEKRSGKDVLRGCNKSNTKIDKIVIGDENKTTKIDKKKIDDTPKVIDEVAATVPDAAAVVQAEDIQCEVSADVLPDVPDEEIQETEAQDAEAATGDEMPPEDEEDDEDEDDDSLALI